MRVLGHNVVQVAPDGVWAVAVCKKFMPDLAVLDVDLPNMRGDKVAQSIRRDATAKYIIVGATKITPMIQEAVSSAGAALLSKPFTIEKVRDALASLMQVG